MWEEGTGGGLLPGPYFIVLLTTGFVVGLVRGAEQEAPLPGCKVSTQVFCDLLGGAELQYLRQVA